MKQILVTGSSGLIGTRFVEMYGDHFHVLHVSRRQGLDILNLATLTSESEKLARGNPIDAIVLLAAYTDVSAAFSQKGDKTSACYRKMPPPWQITSTRTYTTCRLISSSTERQHLRSPNHTHRNPSSGTAPQNYWPRSWSRLAPTAGPLPGSPIPGQ